MQLLLVTLMAMLDTRSTCLMLWLVRSLSLVLDYEALQCTPLKSITKGPRANIHYAHCFQAKHLI